MQVLSIVVKPSVDICDQSEKIVSGGYTSSKTALVSVQKVFAFQMMFESCVDHLLSDFAGAAGE